MQILEQRELPCDTVQLFTVSIVEGIKGHPEREFPNGIQKVFYSWFFCAVAQKAKDRPEDRILFGDQRILQ